MGLLGVCAWGFLESDKKNRRDGKGARQADRDAVQVFLDDTGGRKRRCNAAPENIRQAAALPAVQQDEEYQPEAGDKMDYGNCGFHRIVAP